MQPEPVSSIVMLLILKIHKCCLLLLGLNTFKLKVSSEVSTGLTDQYVAVLHKECSFQLTQDILVYISTWVAVFSNRRYLHLVI